MPPAADSPTTNALLDAAERRIRHGGYNAMSFRDLAEDVNIRSASVHYHFRQKADLVVALVERYEARFLGALDDAASGVAPGERLRVFCEGYRQALNEDGAICLCGMLGAESPGLPREVASAVRGFFDASIEWLVKGFRGQSAERRRARATAIVATLQGAMILATSLDDSRVLDTAIDEVLRTR